MRNFTRLNRSIGRIFTFSLIDNAGDPVQAFDLFVGGLIQEGLSAKTIETYSNHVAAFLDFLTEARVFGFPCSQQVILAAIQAYLPARMAGANAHGEFNIISRQTLRQRRISRDSAKNHAAAINKFLFDSDRHQLHIQQIKEWEAGFPGETPEVIFPASQRKRSSAEIKKISQSSMMVNVMNYQPTVAAKKIVKVRGKSSDSNRDKDFPAEYVLPLLDFATSARDEALWSLQAGAGLRPHEAILVELEHIDKIRRSVVVEDPHNRRFASQMSDEYFAMWKGRTMSDTYFIPILRDRFFKALEVYIRTEFVPQSDNNFVFQSLTGNRKPYALVSAASRIKSFRRACRRLKSKIPQINVDLEELTPHSLRHFYGTYMLNYVPVGRDTYGLRPKEVQRLMGHEKLETTMKYARQDKISLDAKIIFMNMHAMNEAPEVDHLIKWMADKYSDRAGRLIQAMSNRATGND